ncbi:MAG: ketoacyl-ACP synthase III [Bacteroidales bacterium]|jgi:3-oxoacyl-[acyl-carrier-protein] synthase-3|nr:ketoacyl-ACP synthase III [Bacteroidales bacterium]
MAFLAFENVGISAMAACVPPKVSYSRDLTGLMSETEIEKTIESVGIREKRFAAEDVCASDLCYRAATQLIHDNGIDPESIDVLIFLSQTSDYRIPATAPILQQRLGLAQTTACFDINLGCSGFVYALSTAFAYASAKNVNRVLLLVGETFSRITSQRDRVNAPLYGDAGTATLVGKEDCGRSFFSLHSDGTGKDAVMIPAGGMRNPANTGNLEEKEAEDGNIRSDSQIYMDGLAVFNFAMRVVPKNIREILEQSGVALEEIDWLIFHQANKFMTDFFVKKLKIPAGKAPYCLDRYGNTSSASVPLTVVSELYGKPGKQQVLMSGFGAGLSWASAILSLGNCRISPLLEY